MCWSWNICLPPCFPAAYNTRAQPAGEEKANQETTANSRIVAAGLNQPSLDRLFAGRLASLFPLFFLALRLVLPLAAFAAECARFVAVFFVAA